jgi:DNA mismatch repair protein MutL
MGRIQQLPPVVVAKIAAGEVIERPASVVKELLENSIDAGSTRIEVDVEQGGADLIQVVDNGSGIVAADLPLTFASHATSKLRDSEDLFRIGTLGFRGEALASIGGVAQVMLQSRAAGQAEGAQITCHGGQVSGVSAWNGSFGTRIEVRHLFYNTPVRRKFLRATATEMGHVCEFFTRLALARPGLHLILRHHGKAVYEVSASSGLLERLGLFYGAEVKDRLYPVEAAHGAVRLRGFVADPACERGNARMQYLFVNGRWVRDRSLGHALQEAYRGLLMTGRYAVAFLFLDLPADQVDVNVHPTKAEVRFRDGHFLYSMVLGAVRQRLSEANLTARLRVTSTLAGPAEGQAGAQARIFGDRTWLSDDSQQGPRPFAFPEAIVNPRPATPAQPVNGGPDQPPLPGPSQSPDAAFKAIQLYDAYLVLETPQGMLVIDQHALHERILFEQLKARIRAGTLETQRLLVPEPVDLTAEQAARTLEHREALAELGLVLEDFGGGTLLLHGYPAILGGRDPQAILKAVVDHLTTKDRPPAREQLFSNLLSLMACHAAVRAGEPLTQEQIAALVAQRALADDTHHCPHGRPTALLFSRDDLDRQFRRT